MYIRPARNRHGRGLRGKKIPRDVPMYRTRSQRFDAAVLDVYRPILERFGPNLELLDIAVDLIPRMSVHEAPDIYGNDVVTMDGVVLGRLVHAGIDRHGNPTRARIVLFRKPIELRGLAAGDVTLAIRFTLAQLVAQYLNVPVSMVWPE